MNRDNRSVDAECTQAPPAATLSPVPSKWATAAAASRCRTVSRNPDSPLLVRASTVVRVPADMPTPSRSDSVSQARS